MYDVFLDKILLPVTPSKIQLKIKNQNKTINLISEGEVNILRQAGLTDISLTVLIPQVPYPFAKYNSGFQGASFFLDAFERLKTGREATGGGGKGAGARRKASGGEGDETRAFQFIVSRAMPNGANLFSTNIKVSLEEYTITDDTKGGFDITVDIKLKQYRSYATSVVQVQAELGKAPKAIIKPQRPAENPPQARTHTVVPGDSLWAIAQRHLNDGNRYAEIYELNQELIDARNSGTGNSKYTIFPDQVFTLPA